MGDMGHGGAYQNGDENPEESVTGVGGPVLLVTTAPELGRGDVLDGRYQVEASIGTGGSGRVLRAFDRVAREAVALKILRPEYVSDPVWTERFSRELRVGRQIQHRNVCRIFDIGASDGHRFLSMELATRGTIRGQLGDAALQRPMEDRIADARAVVAGAAALHDAGIIHRDLKPENILRMEDGRLVVSDFGLATDPGAGPATTIMVGTPRYMAPEVVMGDPATARADVWALGIVLHEILFGVRPDLTVVQRGVRQYTPPRLTTLRERRLAELCGRCAAEDPRRRPASATEVRREFEAAVLGRRFVRTNDRKQVAWGAVAFAALVALGVVRDRWSSRAVASSSQGSASVSARVQNPMGKPRDWSDGARKLAAFPGTLHCIASLPGEKTVRAVWGTPRRAEDIDVVTGARTKARLAPETFQEGCPQVSPRGDNLLFETSDATGRHIFLSPATDGSSPRMIVRGSAPLWLPNGQEFVFALDSRHAAMFALATGEMTLITDENSGPRVLSEQVVNSSGSRLAVRYTTENLDNRMVVYALPGLKVVTQATLPMTARPLGFRDDDGISFTWAGASGDEELASLTWNTSNARSIGVFPDADIRNVVRTDGQTIVAIRRLRKDLSRDALEGRQPMTFDGESDHGWISSTGDMVIQRRQAGGRYVIVLRTRSGVEQQISQGPLDLTPTFATNERTLLYAKADSGALVECDLEGTACSTIHRDPLIPALVSVSPSGNEIAYVTLMNSPRLRIFSRVGNSHRDLGPSTTDACPAFWASERHLWMSQREGTKLTWLEVDAKSGQRSGRTLSTFVAEDQDCATPTSLMLSARGRGSALVVVSQEVSELTKVRDDVAPIAP